VDPKAEEDPDTVGNLDVTEIHKQRRIQRQQGIQTQGEGNLVWRGSTKIHINQGDPEWTWDPDEVGYSDAVVVQDMYKLYI
jgi:hypothetical protein